MRTPDSPQQGCRNRLLAVSLLRKLGQDAAYDGHPLQCVFLALLTSAFVSIYYSTFSIAFKQTIMPAVHVASKHRDRDIERGGKGMQDSHDHRYFV